MNYERNPYHPSDEERVRILAGLLKLAREGTIGPIYCTGKVVEIGTWVVEFLPFHVCTERRHISWLAASVLVDGPVVKKPVQSVNERVKASLGRTLAPQPKEVNPKPWEDRRRRYLEETGRDEFRARA